MAKNVYQTIEGNKKKFSRQVGLPIEKFKILVEKVEQKITTYKEANPLSTRGKKPELDIPNQLLLMLMYYRNYYTFFTLGSIFEVSEGQANKLFHKMSRIVVKVLALKGRKKMSTEKIQAVIIDASEQPIERPKKKQKQYFSGKKNVIPSRHN